MFNRPRPKTRSGYSLVEIIVASSVAFLILGILANLMISSGRVTRKGMVKVDLQQRMQKLNNDLSRDIGLSSTQGVAVDETATPTPLSIHRRETDTATVTWEPQVIVYHGTGGVLRRDEVLLSPAPTKAFKPLEAEDWVPLLRSDRSTFKFDGLEEFVVTPEPNNLLRVKVKLASGGESLQIERMLLLRQGG